MSGIEIILGVLLVLVVNEAWNVSPWVAQMLVRWSARLRYPDAELRATRTEELAALINERPGKLLKLCTALSFAVAALMMRCWRFASQSGTTAQGFSDRLALHVFVSCTEAQLASQPNGTRTLVTWLPKRRRAALGKAEFRLLIWPLQRRAMRHVMRANRRQEKRILRSELT